MQVAIPDGKPTTTRSTSFPLYSVNNQVLKNAVYQASEDIQSLFDDMIKALAQRTGHRSVDDFVTKQLGGKVYDFTINFMGGHTLPHVDAPEGDGPGKYIYNLALQGEGLLYFAEQRSANLRRGAKATSAAFHAAGDCLGFSGEARLLMQHGVLRFGAVTRLPSSKADDCDDIRGRMRVVCVHVHTHNTNLNSHSIYSTSQRIM